MRIAKLSTDRIVLFLDGPKDVVFAAGQHVLVSNIVTDNPRRIDPYWILDTYVVGVADFGDSYEEAARSS